MTLQQILARATTKNLALVIHGRFITVQTETAEHKIFVTEFFFE